MFRAFLPGIQRNALAASATAGVFGLLVLAASFTRAVPPANAAAPAPTAGAAATAREILGPVAVVPLATQPKAKLVVDLPLPNELAKGVAIIQFRTENARILPVYGPAAVAVSPRVGHLHVTVDDAPWHWAHAQGEPVIVAPLPAGSHKVLIELADANHEILASQAVTFDVPRR